MQFSRECYKVACVISLLSFMASSAAPLQAQAPTKAKADSIPALTAESVTRLVKTRAMLQQASAALPAIRLPMDSAAWKRALTNTPSSMKVLKKMGITPDAYVRDFTRLATAMIGVAAVDSINKGAVTREQIRWEDSLHRNRKEEGPHLFLRVNTQADGPPVWSDWEWIQDRDAAFVREHQAMLMEHGISVSGLGLTDQMPPVLDVISFPNAPRYMTLERLDSTEAPAGQEAGPPLRVLFLADGGTGEPMYRHNEVHRIFQLIAAAGLKRRVVVGLIAGPGAQVKALWRLPVTRSVVRHLPWDYVVLQEHEPNSEWTLQDLAGPLPAIDREVSAASARLVYAVFGLGQVQERLLAATRTIKNPLLVPMSAAWSAVSAADRTIPLWMSGESLWTFDSLVQSTKDPQSGWERMAQDGFEVDSSLQWGTGHFTPQGHYLQALVYYRAITGNSPIGLPAPPIKLRPVNVSKDKKRTVWQDQLITLTPHEVEVLQRAAAEAFTRPIGE